MKHIVLYLLPTTLSLLCNLYTSYSLQNDTKKSENIKYEIVKAIEMIKEDTSNSKNEYTIRNSVITIISRFKNKALEPLINLWSPSSGAKRSRAIVEAIVSKDVLDHTIYEKLYQKNLTSSDPRVAYLNTAIFYASIWDGATSPPEAPRRNWGICPKNFLELILSKIDDTSTMKVSLSNHDDFMRRVIELAKAKIAKNCLGRTTEDEFNLCVDELMPKDSINVSIGEMNKLCFIGLTMPVIHEFIQAQSQKEQIETTFISSNELRDWYQKNMDLIVWGKNERCFIPLSKTKKKSK